MSKNNYNAGKGFYQWHDYQRSAYTSPLTTFVLVFIFLLGSLDTQLINAQWFFWSLEGGSDLIANLQLSWREQRGTRVHATYAGFSNLEYARLVLVNAEQKWEYQLKRCIFKETNSKCQPSPNTVGKNSGCLNWLLWRFPSSHIFSLLTWVSWIYYLCVHGLQPRSSKAPCEQNDLFWESWREHERM